MDGVLAVCTLRMPSDPSPMLWIVINRGLSIHLPIRADGILTTEANANRQTCLASLTMTFYQVPRCILAYAFKMKTTRMETDV